MFWSMKSITAPAISGPTEAMNRMLAITIIQHDHRDVVEPSCPGAREFIRVVTKLMPPSRNATNSSATPGPTASSPAAVRLYSAFADRGGYAVQAPPKPPPSTKNEASSTIALRGRSGS